MRKLRGVMFSAALLFALIGAAAQAPGPGKIICWKDKSGKVVGCGDTVPHEYQDSATKELNRYGVTVRQSDAALTAEQRKAQQAELERRRAEDASKEEQRRQDKILLETYSQEGDIDYERGRRIKPVEVEIDVLQTGLKKIGARRATALERAGQFRKNSKPVPRETQEELERITKETATLESQLAQRRKESAALNKKYDEIKKRYLELARKPSLSSGGRPAPQPAPATATSSGKGG